MELDHKKVSLELDQPLAALLCQDCPVLNWHAACKPKKDGGFFGCCSCSCGGGEG